MTSVCNACSKGIQGAGVQALGRVWHKEVQLLDITYLLVLVFCL